MSDTKEVTTVVKAWARLRRGKTDKRWKLVSMRPKLITIVVVVVVVALVVV